MVYYGLYYYLYLYLKKTEKCDFRPSRIPRPFEIWTQIFFCFLVPLPSCPKKFFITLGNRDHGFLDTRKWWFWPNYHIYISLSDKWNFLLLLKLIFLSIYFDFMVLVEMLTVEKEHLRFFFFLPWGLASPLIYKTSRIIK